MITDSKNYESTSAAMTSTTKPSEHLRPVYGNLKTGPMLLVSSVDDELIEEAQARIDRVDVKKVMAEQGSIWTFDNGQGFVKFQPGKDALFVLMAFGRKAGSIMRQIEYWKEIAFVCGYDYLACVPGSDGMERYLQMLGFQPYFDSYRLEV